MVVDESAHLWSIIACMNEQAELFTEDIGSSARKLSERGASRGGKARAASLSHEARSEIARRAALSRWGTEVLPASNVGQLIIGDQEINCAVLGDGTRVINQETYLSALGRARKAKGGTGGTTGDIPPFLSALNLQPFVSPQLREMAKPIRYSLPNGQRAVGYKAEMLPAVCEVYLEAAEQKVLLPSQRPALRASQILIRGLARVGIIALIDEATGYQETRARQELQRILEAYVQAELRPWIKTFPDEFFREIYRIEGWDFRPGTSKRTPYVGKLVNRYVYEQLPPGVLDDLQRKNPRSDRGYRMHKHHQFLTLDTGNVHLDRQIATVTMLLRIANTKDEFVELFERAYPPIEPRLPLVVEIAKQKKVP